MRRSDRASIQFSPWTSWGPSYLTRWVSGCLSSSFVPIVLMFRSEPSSAGSEPCVNQYGDYEVLGFVNVLVEMTGAEMKAFLQFTVHDIPGLRLLPLLLPRHPNLYYSNLSKLHLICCCSSPPEHYPHSHLQSRAPCWINCNKTSG